MLICQGGMGKGREAEGGPRSSCQGSRRGAGGSARRALLRAGKAGTELPQRRAPPLLMGHLAHTAAPRTPGLALDI